jgi:hypothetical protein
MRHMIAKRSCCQSAIIGSFKRTLINTAPSVHKLENKGVLELAPEKSSEYHRASILGEVNPHLLFLLANSNEKRDQIERHAYGKCPKCV